ncbi:hypothetical protein ABZ297_39565 [Nonomuraea sp. NPDC005983]|uniref:hypothetical protein n=1 Tax=Nonomuraea sp. NPDC005983 TaxID=3155595 RepID=UPI0033BCC391
MTKVRTFVRSDASGGSRTYRLTEAGREHALRHLDGEAPWDEVARTVPEDRHELRLLWAQLDEECMGAAHRTKRSVPPTVWRRGGA